MTVGNVGVPELLIIAGVIVLLFGAKKLPEMARSLGKSAKAFKEETKGLRGDLDAGNPLNAKPAPPSSDTRPVTDGAEQAQQHKTAG